MTKQQTLPPDHFSALERLHERVNAMLDMPAGKDGDEFPLPLEATLVDPTAQTQTNTEHPQ